MPGTRGRSAGAPEIEAPRLVQQGEGWARYHIATLDIELFPRETEGYRYNLSHSGRWFMCCGATPTRTSGSSRRFFHVTVCPYEAQDYLDGGDLMVEGVPIPDLVAHWMQGYIARHHVDAPFEKRRRKRHSAASRQSRRTSLADPPGFLERWSRLKRAERDKSLRRDPAPPAVRTADSPETPADPLEDLPALETLTKDSDFRAFMRPGVPRNCAIRHCASYGAAIRSTPISTGCWNTARISPSRSAWPAWSPRSTACWKACRSRKSRRGSAGNRGTSAGCGCRTGTRAWQAKHLRRSPQRPLNRHAPTG